MDWKTFITELVKALAWPSLIGIGLYTYHRAILNLLAALIRMLKRAQSIKYGDLVLATQSVSKAIEAKENEAEKAAIAMTQPDTTQADREQLAAQLRDAVEESTRLRSTLENLQINAVERPQSTSSPALRHKARFRMMLHLLANLGTREVIRLGDTGQLVELENKVNAVIQEARQPGNNSPGFSTQEELINRESGLIDEHGNITKKGLKELLSRVDPLLRSGKLGPLPGH